MHLPSDLLQRIEKRIQGQSLSQLSLASEALTKRYRSGSTPSGYVQEDKDRMAYILARMPATYAVIYRVLEELKERYSAFSPISCLDVGSGPGTGLWAAKEVLKSLRTFTAWDYDEGFIHLSKTLCADDDVLSSTHFFKKNIEVDRDFPLSSLAIVSYAIGEIEEKYWDSFFSSLWHQVEGALVIIEPGTPIGYQRILKIRQLMLSLGANLIAPCPHSYSCPLSSPDWCHFYARVERSSLHRHIKGGSLGFEDEKFSYLIFVKDSQISSCKERILRFPQIHKGHVNLSLCTKEDGVIGRTYTKKDKEKYKLIKKLSWGDSI